MSEPEALRADVIALTGTMGRLDSLLRGLARRGVGVDRVDGLADLLACFERAGGHDALILAPDLPQMLVGRAVASLSAIANDLLVVSFAHPLPQVPRSRLVSLHALHPASPLAVGAVLRALWLRAVL
jgi:hypothetical protein